MTIKILLMSIINVWQVIMTACCVVWSRISWYQELLFTSFTSGHLQRQQQDVDTQIVKYHDITFNLQFIQILWIWLNLFFFIGIILVSIVDVFYLETCRCGSGIGTFLPNDVYWGAMFLGGRWERQWIKFVWRNYCKGGKADGRSFMVVLVKQIYFVLCNGAKINVTLTLQRIILSWTVT